MEPELVVDAKAELGEGCVWYEGVVYWLDILPGLVHRYDPRTGEDVTVDVGQPVGALVPRAGGGLLLAVRDGFAELPDLDGKPELILPIESDDETTRMNDGKCDRRGRFWASTMPFAGDTPVGRLYRLSTDLSVDVMLEDLTIGNGLAWSADDTRFFFIDSMTHGVDVFDFDVESGTLTNRWRLFGIDPEDGIPDGMTIDAEDHLWVALFAGGAVRRYTPDGELDRVVPLPASNVTCCAFGGEDLGDLYITTARHNLTDAEAAKQPLAGGLFRIRPGVTGTPTNVFRG